MTRRKTKAQKNGDVIFIANLLLREPHLLLNEVRNRINAVRTYQLTLKEVEEDIAASMAGYSYPAVDALDLLRQRELRQINTREAFCWAVYLGDAKQNEKSEVEFLGRKLPRHRAERIVRGFKYELNEKGEMKPVPVTSQTVINTLKGNAEWLRASLAECSRSRRDLLGLDAPKRTEIAVEGDGKLDMSPLLEEAMLRIYGEQS